MAIHQTLPSLIFSRQEHWSGLPLPSPNSIMTPPYFSPFLEKGSPEPVQEILASNRGCSSLGQQDHWMDHKCHIPAQQDLHSLFSFPCLYSNDLEVASPERQWGFTKPLDYFANNKFSYRRYTALEVLWLCTVIVTGRFMDAHEKRHVPFNLMQAPPLTINHTQNFRGFPCGSVVKNLTIQET